MSRSLSVTRSGQADLQVWAPPVYTVIGDLFAVGAQTYRRQTAQGPFTPGRQLIGAQPDVQTVTFSVEVTGASGDDLRAQTAQLLNAFRQFSYALSGSWDGQPFSWLCEVADFNVTQTDLQSAYFAQTVVLQVPRSPIPLTGAI